MDLETLQNEVYELLPVDSRDEGLGVGIQRSRSMLGSSDSCDVVLRHPSISGIHAILEIKGNVFKLYDMNSKNGSLINGKKIVVKKFKLGDTITLGEKSYIFQEYKKEDIPPPILDMLTPASIDAPAVSEITLPERPKSFDLDISDKSDGLPHIEYPLAKDLKAEFSEYIFEDVENLYPIFNYDMEMDSVEVIIMFEGRIYSVDYLPVKNSQYYLSGKFSDDASIEYAYLGKNERLPFVLVSGAEVVVETIPGYSCLNVGGDKPTGTDVGARVTLGENCILCMSHRDLQIFVRRSSAPPSVKAAPFLRRDPELKRNIIAMLALVALFLFVTTFFEVDDELDKEKDPERIATILYKKPAVTKAIAKTNKKKKQIVQKSKTKKRQISKKDKKKTTVKNAAKKKTTKKNVRVLGFQSKKKVDKIKRARPRKGPTKNNTSLVRVQSKSSGSTSKKKTSSKRKATLKNSKGHVDTYKAVDFKSTISSLMSKGGSTKSLNVVKNMEEDIGNTSVTGGESATLERAKISQNIGSLTGATSGTLDSTKGVSGLVDKKSIYTAGLPFKTVILGGMDPDTIRKILIDHIPQFRYCYQKVLDRSKREFSGIVKLDFIIGASGHVTKAAADSVDRMPLQVQSCVVNVLRGIRFPEPRGGGIVEVSQPMNFYPNLK